MSHNQYAGHFFPMEMYQKQRRKYIHLLQCLSLFTRTLAFYIYEFERTMNWKIIRSTRFFSFISQDRIWEYFGYRYIVVENHTCTLGKGKWTSSSHSQTTLGVLASYISKPDARTNHSFLSEPCEWIFRIKNSNLSH